MPATTEANADVTAAAPRTAPKDTVPDATTAAKERSEQRTEVMRILRQQQHQQQWMNYNAASAMAAVTNRGVAAHPSLLNTNSVPGVGTYAHAVMRRDNADRDMAHRASPSMRQNAEESKAKAASRLPQDIKQKNRYPAETYTLPDEHKAKVSPFNPMEKEWKTQAEFLREAKEHLGKIFGIHRFSVYQSSGNPDSSTKEALPRDRALYLCGSCKKSKRDMPHTTKGCCGFNMTTGIKKTDAGDSVLVVKKFNLSNASIHLTDPPGPPPKTDGKIVAKKDLNPEQIKFIEDEALKNTVAPEIRKLVAERWPDVKIQGKLVGRIYREARDEAGIARKPVPPVFELPRELIPKVSPFNPEESKWYSHQEFVSQARTHMANTFGIKELPILDCEKNRDPQTVKTFPYYRFVVGCGSCRRRVKEMPKEKWGCCGFSMRALLVRGKGGDRPYMTIREFVLTTNSVHAGYLPGAEEVNTGPIRSQADLSEDQISMIKCFGRRRTDVNTVCAIFTDAYGIDLLGSLAYRVMKKGKSEATKDTNDNSNPSADEDDDVTKKARYDRCIALGKQLSCFAREDVKIYDMVMPELAKLVNKCAQAANDSLYQKGGDDEEEEEDGEKFAMYDEWISENPSKRARLS